MAQGWMGIAGLGVGAYGWAWVLRAGLREAKLGIEVRVWVGGRRAKHWGARLGELGVAGCESW